MSATTVRFCQDLAQQIPELRAIMEEHLSENIDLLPHLFMGDVTRYVLNNGAARSFIISALEKSFDSLGREIDELIAVSFVENVETRQDLERALQGIDAPKLAAEWRRQKL